MPQFKTELLSVHHIADNTIECLFQKPAGFMYQAGQFCTWVYENQPMNDKRGNRRVMSFASSPTESELKITMRVGPSAYKQSLQHAPQGTPFSIIGPAGKFVLPTDTSKHIVFLAGGVGVTPFRSILKYVLDSKSSYAITMIYSNLCCKTAAYSDELGQYQQEIPNFHFVPTMTSENPEHGWKGETRLINESLLRETVKDIPNSIYMIVGPPGMVEAMITLLQSLNIPKEQILSEKFTGL